ncbi:hypothetical protein QL285_049427 [Trifolium repens]|nr:hypothetical protein QL285_049427 [Trifolium repens]
MGILKVYLVVAMSFLFLSIVVADLDFYHNTKGSIRYPSMPPKNLKLGVLPKGIHILPLEAITKTSNSPLSPLCSTNLNFGMLPRGPSRPSVPDPIVSPSPPQPPHHF